MNNKQKIIIELINIMMFCEMEEISFSDCCAQALINYRQETKQ